ncbi:Gluconolactonase [Pseudomonas syringae pv. maculicola]|uniref:Gluconolactonase n=1 Tax=Pseudomonas savastanoi pv. glycinea TaxID=318 RepID=A0A3M3G823_PSESG|nr:Gluconolactonase [Pseudomonas syringae pv. maculicola]RMM70407.1 Gluconolactonase [Pseudomonas savastanoi pv. glycinea]
MFSASGELLGKIKVTAKDTGNLAFCSTGSQHWIYITAANKVLRIPALVGGSRS